MALFRLAEMEERRLPKLNDKNLIPTTERTKDEARELGRNGGIKSGIARKRKKTLGELLDLFLDHKVTEPDVIAKLQTLGIPEEECTNKAKMMMHMAVHASKGNSTFMKMLMDYSSNNATIELQKKQIEIENKRMKLEIQEQKIRIAEQRARLEEQQNRIEEQKLRIQKLRAEITEKNDMEDLTPLADLLKDDEEESEITEDGD